MNSRKCSGRYRPMGLQAALIWIAAAIVTISSAHAEYLGNYGNLWPIDEEHAVEQTINKLKEMERTGELKERMDRYKADVIDSIENPDPVPGVQTVTFPRTYLLDPSVTVQENVMDDAGKLMVLAGTRINPLSTRVGPSPCCSSMQGILVRWLSRYGALSSSPTTKSS